MLMTQGLHMSYILRIYKSNNRTGENVHISDLFYNDTIVLYVSQHLFLSTNSDRGLDHHASRNIY